jgi:hypothetical protein
VHHRDIIPAPSGNSADDDAGRQARLSGRVAAALMAKAADLPARASAINDRHSGGEMTIGQ